MLIYVQHNGQQLGPFTEEQLKAQLASGAISLQDHVWWEGQAGWVLLGQSGWVGAEAPPTPVAVPPTPTPAQLYTGPRKTSGLAVASMVCGISGLFCGLLSLVAIIFGHVSRSQIKKDPALEGGGFALAGLILGYVWLPLYTLILVISILIALGNQVKNAQGGMSAQPAWVDPSTTNSAPGK